MSAAVASAGMGAPVADRARRVPVRRDRASTWPWWAATSLHALAFAAAVLLAGRATLPEPTPEDLVAVVWSGPAGSGEGAPILAPPRPPAPAAAPVEAPPEPVTVPPVEAQAAPAEAPPQPAAALSAPPDAVPPMPPSEVPPVPDPPMAPSSPAVADVPVPVAPPSPAPAPSPSAAPPTPARAAPAPPRPAPPREARPPEPRMAEPRMADRAAARAPEPARPAPTPPDPRRASRAAEATPDTRPTGARSAAAPPSAAGAEVAPTGLRPGAGMTSAPGLTEGVGGPRGDCAVNIEYPFDERRRGVAGAVTLRLRIRDNGGVVAARVIESSGSFALDEAALAGIRRCRFVPAMRDGVNVFGTREHRVLFTLNGEVRS